MFHVEHRGKIIIYVPRGTFLNFITMEITGNLIDIHGREIYPAKLRVKKGKIAGIEKIKYPVKGYILPGLIDAHVHVESSMLIPSEFARAAVPKGVVAVVTDPHEISNVFGRDGLEFMISNSERVPFKFFYGAPSCVPATPFENSGGKIDAQDIKEMISSKKVHFLSEMMNFPGVIQGDPDIMGKINIAREFGIPVDGHAPGLSGNELDRYIKAGISTDHECTNIVEAREKISRGMKILIREGSAAKNFDALIDLIDDFPDKIMFCSDDIHPDDLKEKYLLDIIKRGLSKNKDLYDLIRSCSIIPKDHYNLNTGCLRSGDPADFVVVDSLTDWNVVATYINGEVVFDNGKVNFPQVSFEPVDAMKCKRVSPVDVSISFSKKKVNIIAVEEDQIVTSKYSAFYENDSYIKKDKINKIVVLNRFREGQNPAIGYIKGFALKNMAIAQTIAHDSHNIISIGDDDNLLTKAINQLISLKGGIVVCSPASCLKLKLDFGGLMSSLPVDKVAKKYTRLKKFVLENGCQVKEPFMTLSFMALLVIPELKISDKGLFDVTRFNFVELFEP
jgi:adenine deaminase